MVEPATSAAAIAKAALAKFSPAALGWIKAEVVRRMRTAVAPKGRLRLAWAAMGGRELVERATVEQELADDGVEWPPDRCVRLGVFPASDSESLTESAVLVEGDSARACFRVSVFNVAPFPVDILSRRVETTVVFRTELGRDTCAWPGSDERLGYVRIEQGAEVSWSFDLGPATRTFPKQKPTSRATLLSVSCTLVMAGPWQAHEQREKFTASAWLPTDASGTP